MSFLAHIFGRKEEPVVASQETPEQTIARAKREYLEAAKVFDEARKTAAKLRTRDVLQVINCKALCPANAMKNQDPRLTAACRLETIAEADRLAKLRTWLVLAGKIPF
jgi:hypothetical protein